MHYSQSIFGKKLWAFTGAIIIMATCVALGVKAYTNNKSFGPTGDTLNIVSAMVSGLFVTVWVFRWVREG